MVSVAAFCPRDMGSNPCGIMDLSRQPGGLWFKSHILFPQLTVQRDFLSQAESKVCGRVGYGRSRKKQEKDDLTDSNLDQVEICLSIDIVE